ncbi:MAG: cyclic nucleotide-binding domain-containing protein [Spirochaetota bacterium]
MQILRLDSLFNFEKLLPAEEIVISLLSIYGGYFLFKRNSPDKSIKSYIDIMLYGIAAACIIILLQPFLTTIVPFRSPILTGFFRAAFVEKLMAFVFLVFYIRSKKDVTIEYAINSGIFFGASFACFENMIYAIDASASVLFIRLFSSVLIHITTCAAMGFYIGLYKLYYSPWKKYSNLAVAFVFPYVLHGLYDSFLMLGGRFTYGITPIFLFTIIAIEYTIARSHILPLPSYLEKNKMHLEDWSILQRQPEYERWITRSMSSSNQVDIPFFKFKASWKKRFRILFFLGLAGASLLFKKELDTAVKLSSQEFISLFLLYPLVLALHQIINNSINSEYFKYSRLSIPVFSGVNFHDRPKVKDVLAPDINSFNSFMITFEPLEVGSAIEIGYFYANLHSIPLKARVAWENHDDSSLPLGSIVHFQIYSWKFFVFLFRHSLFRIWKGILFNLKFPGFKEIRNFFVKTVTVMEELEFHDANEVLFKEGEVGKKFYLIKKGTVKIVKTLESGEEMRMAEINPGQIFGELAILGGQTRAATAICDTDCILAVASSENLRALISGNQEFSYKLIETLAKRIKNSEKIMSQKVEMLEMKNIDHDLLKENTEISCENFQFFLQQLQNNIATSILDESFHFLFSNQEWKESFPNFAGNKQQSDTLQGFLKQQFLKKNFRNKDLFHELCKHHSLVVYKKPAISTIQYQLELKKMMIGKKSYYLLTADTYQ